MTTRFGKNSLGYLWAIIGPAGGLAMMSIVFSMIARRPSIGDNFPIFFATGYLAFEYFSDISRALSQAVRSNRSLLTFPRVTILDTLIARFILHFITVTFVAVVIMAGLLIYFDDQIVIDFRHIAVAVALGALLGLAIGVFNCMLYAYSPFWERTYPILTRPLFIISGIFFIYEDLPKMGQDILWWNPLVHVTGVMRQGFYPIYDAAYVSYAYVIGFALVPLSIGLLLIKALRGKLLEE